MSEIADSEERLQTIVQEARPALLVSLAKVDYIDSSGTGLLVNLLQWTRESDRKLLLTELPAGVADVFRLSNLDKLFEIVAGEDEARQVVHPPKVFLFDDREETIYFYQEVLRANRLEFQHSVDLEETLRLLREGAADLLLIDALEKEESKYELARRVKQDKQLATLPIVVLSIYEDEEQVFQQLGVERFVFKPFLVEKFVATLKQLLAPRPGN